MATKQNIIIFDIDGVIIDYPNVINGSAIVAYSIYQMTKLPLIHLIFLTGRSKYEKEETINLLSSIGISDVNRYELIMKPTKNESTYEYKKSFLEKIDTNTNTVTIFEDDRTIIDLSKRLGIKPFLSI